MNRKTLLIVGGVLVLVAFLLGFVPQYMKARDLGNQLGAFRRQLDSEREKSQMDEVALLCGYIYLETNLKNYGLASQYSTQVLRSRPSHDGTKRRIPAGRPSSGGTGAARLDHGRTGEGGSRHRVSGAGSISERAGDGANWVKVSAAGNFRE